jgi:hypothetical protein
MQEENRLQALSHYCANKIFGAKDDATRPGLPIVASKSPRDLLHKDGHSGLR